MSKKSKSAKSSAVTTENGDLQKATYVELIAQDHDFHLGTSTFEFPNGDKYEGEFCAHASGLIWRQGKGTYSTKDGQIYIGEWDGDKLIETIDVEIDFPDGSKYFGPLAKSKYSGPGIYQLEDKVSLTCSFIDNKPTGEITLIDPNGKVWHGFAENDESLLVQEHPFYRSIGKDLGKGRTKLKPVQQDHSKTSVSERSSTKSEAGPKYSDLRDLERDIFAKSKKTPSNIELDSSEWYQDYVTYCNTYGGIIRNVKANGENSLNPEQYNWYNKYKEFEKKYKAMLEDHTSKKKKDTVYKDNALFKFIHSEEYRTMNKPTPVFYPSNDLDEEDCDSNCEC